MFSGRGWTSAPKNEFATGKAKGKAKSNTPMLINIAETSHNMPEKVNWTLLSAGRLEIQRVVQILSRRTKNNPCLVGEPGVGKTAIAEGLALKIIEGNIPDTIKDKRWLHWICQAW